MSDGPVFRQVGDDYLVDYPHDAVAFEFTHISDDKGGIAATLRVVVAGLLGYWGKLTLSSSRSRAEVVKDCAATRNGIQWRARVDDACQQVDAAYRTGPTEQPIVSMRPPPGRYFVPGFIPVGVPTVLFGDGGTGKSLLVLAMLACAAIGQPLGRLPVAPLKGATALYLDWETDVADHNERLWGLEQGLGPVPAKAIYHRRMTRPLAEEGAAIRRLTAERGAKVVVVDSAMLASAGPEPESAAAPRGVIETLRSLGPDVTSLVIAHVSKADKGRRQANPWGSVFWTNLPRSVVGVSRPEDEEPGEMTLTLTHRKSNRTLARPVGVKFVFSDEGEILVRGAEADVSKASISAQILAELRSGPKSAQVLAVTLGVSVNLVRARLSHLAKRTLVINLGAVSGGRGHKGLWGLAEKSAQGEPW